MYWKEIPVQVHAQDGDESVSVPLHHAFQEAVDSIAMFEGSAGSDEYLDGWDWCGFRAVDGGAEQAAHASRRPIQLRYARRLCRKTQGPTSDRPAAEGIPGAIDHWFDE